jgi:hypothetical protein
MIDYSTYDLDFSKFNLTPDQFDQQSHIHGIGHTYRVMLHCLRLGILSNNIKDAKIAVFGAYIHDMARLHDGYCTIHGADSAKIKLPLYWDLFIRHGASDDNLDTIKQIVTRHSVSNEPPKEHLIYSTLAILKDADALDRIRLGKHDLNPDFLRIGITHHSIPFGEDLFFATNNNQVKSFSQMIDIANEIDQLINMH